MPIMQAMRQALDLAQSEPVAPVALDGTPKRVAATVRNLTRESGVLARSEGAARYLDLAAFIETSGCAVVVVVEHRGACRHSRSRLSRALPAPCAGARLAQKPAAAP